MAETEIKTHIAQCPPVEAARLAVAAASCAVTGFGPQESYPDRTALDAMARAVRVEIYPPTELRTSS